MKLKKISWKLIAVYFIVGFAVSACLVLVGGRDLPYEMTEKLAGVIVLGIVLFALSVLGLGALLYMIGKKRMSGMLSEQNFTSTSRFDSYNAVIAVDAVHGKIGVLMRLNPFQVQILEASHIDSAVIHDGKGITGGTSLVSFVFLLDGVKFKIPTFSSNRCYNMNSNEVQRGLEKAQKQVDYLLEAKRNAING